MFIFALAHSDALTALLGDAPLRALTAPALLALAVLFVITGFLVPRRTYKEIVRDRDYWRTAHQISEEQRNQQANQIDHLLEVGHTVEAIMNALPKPPSLPPPPDGGK